MKEVLSRAGRFKKVNGNLQVKEVEHNGKRCVVCLNPDEEKRDAAAREAIIEALRKKLKSGAKQLVGGYRLPALHESGVRLGEDSYCQGG